MFMEYFLIFLTVVIVVVIIVTGEKKKYDANLRIKYYAKEAENTMRKQGLDSPSVVHFEYIQKIPKHEKMFSVNVDEANKKMYIFVDEQCHTLNFSDIIGFEVKVDNESLDAGGRAMAGAVLGGAAGAIVGASSASGKISSCTIYIYTKSIANPYIEIVLFRNHIMNRQYMFTNYGPKGFIDRLSATLKAIINSNNTTNP